MSEINIDRTKLAEYIKQHAQVIAESADIDLHIIKVEAMGGATQFIQTVDIEIREIPLEAVEV